jgi:ATP-binding cassette subfamily C protein
VPRYVLETVAFGGIIIITLYLLLLKKDMNQVLPILSLYAYAGYRLMPALQNMFAGVARARYFLPSLDILHQNIKSHFEEATTHSSSVSKRHKPLIFEDHIKFDNVSFRYPGCTEPVIKQLSMVIRANTTIGLVGATGAGKTTLVDIISGLLRPESGRLLVDNEEISQNNIFSWQQSIGYVPQQIYLLDDALCRNVAFGISDDDIDRQAVIDALKIANLYDFVSRELPNGLDAIIGERGICLSGGQRQRLGLARALYHRPKMLILDEATSAVDGITENVIMDALAALDHQKTIVVIAHRIATVKECDLIFIMDDGKIVDSGTYNQLIESNKCFRAMAR